MKRNIISLPSLLKKTKRDHKIKYKKTIALAGNPNVGKSSLFNMLTGMNQHTGNWPGKTVKSAAGKLVVKDTEYTFIDLPGCYSLKSHSPEEEVARECVISGIPDLIIAVCDATALERNFNLVLQLLELNDNVILCINLIDEAKKNGITIDTVKLSSLLSIPVITTSAHSKSCINTVIQAIENFDKAPPSQVFVPVYPQYIENAVQTLSDTFEGTVKENRFRAIELLEKTDIPINGKKAEEISDDIVYTLAKSSEKIIRETVTHSTIHTKTLYADKLLTSKTLGFVCMFLLLVTVFWITITGANYPSELLSKMFISFEPILFRGMTYIGIPKIICDMTVYGVYHILTWIISVMLPPMAIFFPLFTLLEEVGYLPRIAFNLDRCFKCCSACGKQALTMCMGFGCNAAGVVGCRIIDSPRERLIAILTNAFVPCNGRFPSVIAIISMFFLANSVGLFSTLLSALCLALTVIIGITVSLAVSKILSKTLLKGVPSAFTLELPPYRKPQFGKILTRSLLDRTLFVLGRAITVAAPAGLIIWLLSNITVGDSAIITHISDFLDPLGKIMGLDGIILTAFILGFPANEIVFPLIIMMYTATNQLTDTKDLIYIKEILTANGWTAVTAINTILFTLMHWPCSTTCLTVKAETRSMKYTFLSVLIPTVCGFIICSLVNLIF